MRYPPGGNFISAPCARRSCLLNTHVVCPSPFRWCTAQFMAHGGNQSLFAEWMNAGMKESFNRVATLLDYKVAGVTWVPRFLLPSVSAALLPTFLCEIFFFQKTALIQKLQPFSWMAMPKCLETSIDYAGSSRQEEVWGTASLWRCLQN